MNTSTLLPPAPPTNNLPTSEEMYRALCDRDTAYEGIFFVGVKTTGIFCRPTCSAKKPHRRNVEFFPSTRDCLSSGYRPCKRCRPLETAGAAPEWIQGLIERVERDPQCRIADQDLRRMELDPVRVRRWFKQNHGITFHTYQRVRRLAVGMQDLHSGDDVLSAAFDSGYESLSGFCAAFKNWMGAAPGQANEKRLLLVTRLTTPLGPMIAAGDEAGVQLLEFADRRQLRTQFQRLQRRLKCVFAPGQNPHLQTLQKELGQYFNATRKNFTVPMAMAGTEFQERVWIALRQIPYGETESYEGLANSLGKPGAQRAVGRANGDNRLAILVPCHRVIRHDGQLSGYGGGVWRKKWLLELESGKLPGS